ncbi:DUF1800 family protein [Terriglobus albidus]|uniref:DUF1800 family protein n=1 Tax=Terriglobus albidus TaxID=1592106 RepID=UPI0021E0C197|nr:DUF1800 family protein [Terriglobus albidus]
MHVFLRRFAFAIALASIFLVAVRAHAQSVTITPGYTNLGVGATQQYSAVVTGLSDTSVTWEVSGVKGGNATVGTISPTGLYTAPAQVPAVSTLIEALASDNKTVGVVYVNIQPAGPTVTAVSPSPIPMGNFTITVTGSGFQKGAMYLLNGASGSATYVNSTTLQVGGYWNKTTGTLQIQNPGTLWSPVYNLQFKSVTPQTIAPSSTSVTLGKTQQFSSPGATSWTASAGTITSSGLYTAPSTMPSSKTVTVTATGPGGSANAAVTLVPLPPQTIVPAAVSLNLGVTQQFTSAGATGWTASAGTISSTGLYTAPSVQPAGGTATVTATGPGGTATAIITVINSTPTTISPVSASLILGTTQQFSSGGGTTWTAQYGTVSSTGLYTAPAGMPASGSDTVTVTGPGGSATALVALLVPTPVINSVGNGGQLPLGLFSSTVTGSGFIPTSTATLNGSPITTAYNSPNSLTISGFASKSGQGTLVVGNGSTLSQPAPVQIGIQNALVSSAAARRFLEQAAFGPTPSEANTVQAVGFQQWITNQFNMPQVSNYSAVTGSQGGLATQFMANAVMNPDQLRQKVAFALSQIFVTSINTLIWNDSVIPYQQMLMNDAFSNYRQILGDVTLSPAMGQYLNMANNAKANSALGTVANENYAREVMQLFTIGTVMLNPDGTPQLDSHGLFIPTYNQATVGETARVFTGWTYQPAGGSSVYWNAYINPAGPMVPYPAEHDSGSKNLVNGYVASAGLSPQADLDGALDNIFNHPNVGPFVSKLLIQHLVKSNPSPAYIKRVADAFNDNGRGVRGDMKAVITAILLDPEARANDEGGSEDPGDGHLQEPILYVAGVVRAFGGTVTNQNYFSWELSNMGEDLYNAPSVFNYYSPTFGAPGSTLLGPEFQLYTPDSAIYRGNMMGNLFSSYSNPVLSYGPGTSIDLTPYLALASNPNNLVAALDLTLTHGTMPATMKQNIVTAVTNDTNGNLSRVQTGAWLILSSGYYNVWH